MRRLFPCLILMLGLLCFLRPPAAFAESPAKDLTARCEFSVSGNSADIRRMVDDDPGTAWVGESDSEPYVQIKLPLTQATISIVWDGSVRGIVLEKYTDAGWEPVAILNNPDPMPKTLQLAVPAGRVRLRCEGTMRIAELRVTEGLVDGFFERHTFRGNSVATATRTLQTPSPLSIGMSGKPVRTLQKRLTELGYVVSDKEVVFSQKTHQELAKFQRANGLPDTGVLDTETGEVLFSSSAVSATPKPYDSSAPLPRTASALVQFAYEKVGKGYIYGSSGDICSKWFREQNAKLYPHYADTLLGLAQKWDGEEVFDCVGLVKSFLAHSEGDFPAEWNTNVVGAAKKWMVELDTIDTMPREAGIILLQKDPESKSFSHMGVYVGNGKFIHARGHMYGVVEETMPQLWTHWGRVKWLEYDHPSEDPVPWKPYLAAGDVALVDTSYGGGLPLYDLPSSKMGRMLGVRLPNMTYVVIDGVPEDAKGSFWRQVTIQNSKGKPVTGYVYAKDLTVTSSMSSSLAPPSQTN